MEKKKSNWGWGKKPKPYKQIDIDEPIDVPIYESKKIETRKLSSVKSQKFSDKNWEQKQKIMERLNRQRDKKKKSKGDKKGVLVIKDYMAFLHQRYGAEQGNPMEVHHWMPKSRIQHNDFFVCCLSPKVHFEIHHGHSSVNNFIESRGLENLLMDSTIMFAEWLGTSTGAKHRYFNYYYGMLMEIKENPTDFNYVLETTRKLVEEIRFSKEKI